MAVGGSNGAQITSAATSWTSTPDERLTDTTELYETQLRDKATSKLLNSNGKR